MTSVIVIDDEPDAVESFIEYLGLKKITVLGEGHNGKDAVDLYQKLKPDIVFLDLLMPDYDGIYGLKKIKQLNPDANIIMITSSLTYETENELKELKASAIIYKPFDMDEVIATVNKLVTQSSVKTI